MDNLLLNCQKAAGLLLKQAVATLNVSQDNFAYALAESLGKHDGADTVKGYYRKVPRKFLVPGYKEFRRSLLESVDKLGTKGFVCDVDFESVRDSWAQYGDDLLCQLDKIHEKAVDIHTKSTIASHQQKIKDLLAD